MLTSVVAFAVIGGIKTFQDPDARSIISNPFKTSREKVMDGGKEVEADVTYYATFSLLSNSLTPSEQMNRVFRILDVRPEHPGERFNMSCIFEKVDPNEGEMLEAYLTFREFGASESIGAEILKAIKSITAYSAGVGKDAVSCDPNSGIKPDGWTHREYGHSLSKCVCAYQITKVWSIGGKKSSKVEKGGTIEIGDMWTPKRDPLVDRFRPDGEPEKETQEEMGGVTVKPSPTANPFQIFLPQIKGNPYYPSIKPVQYIKDVTEENGSELVDLMVKEGFTIPRMIDILGKIAPEGTDMNRLSFLEGGDPCDSDMDFPPGTIWIPSDPAYQSMMTGVRFNRRILGFDLYASLNPAPQDGKFAMRTLCLNMEKREPAKGVKYYPYRPSDPVIPMLARRMDESRSRGPWDQARMWIYTDKATMEMVNHKLVNGVGTSAYLMALADVGWAGGLSDKMLKDPKFFTPELMLGSGAPEYASSYLMEVLDDLHPKKAGDWLRKNATSMLQLVGPQADQDDNKHLAETLRRLTLFNAPEDREAALKFMLATQKELAGLKGQLGSGRLALYSGRNEEVAPALALVKAGYLTPAKDALEFVAVNGPGDANKALAKEILGGL